MVQEKGGDLMGYAKRISKADGFMDGLFWLIDTFWQVGAVISFGCIGGFLYSLPGAFHNLDMKESDILGNMFPKLYPIVQPFLCFALPIMWLMLAAVFAWASHRSWIKKNQEPSRWY